MNDNYLSKRAHLKGKNDYTIEGVLGSGGFGVTYKATAYSGNIRQRYAIKEFFQSDICQRQGDNVVCISDKAEYEKSIKSFLEEAERFNGGIVRHNNIVGINEVFRANGTAYYVMEYVSGKTIRGYLDDVRHGSAWEEKDAIQILTPVMNALSLLHSKNITHLDIKPDNIVLNPIEDSDELRPVLIDFGLAKHYDAKGNVTTKIKLRAGSHGYSPCEQFMPEGMNRFSPASDVYSLAATLLYMLTGKNPVSASEITPEIISSSLPQSVSPNIKDAIINAMKLSRSERTGSVAEFAKQLGVTLDVETGNKTVKLSDNGGRKRLSDKLIKKLLVGLGVIVGVAIIGVAISKCDFSKGKELLTDTISQDTTITQDTITQVSKDSENEAPTDVDKDSDKDNNTSDNNVASQPTVQPSQQQPVADNKPEYGTLNLGYATWKGNIKNGNPDGKGKLKFTSNYNFYGESVSAGYYGDATFENGELVVAKVYNDTGELIRTILP